MRGRVSRRAKVNFVIMASPTEAPKVMAVDDDLRCRNNDPEKRTRSVQRDMKVSTITRDPIVNARGETQKQKTANDAFPRSNREDATIKRAIDVIAKTNTVELRITHQKDSFPNINAERLIQPVNKGGLGDSNNKL
jgi:hypothetical protein